MTGFVRYTSALVALAICSACSGAGAGSVAPSNAAPSVQYKGGTAFVNGRPVTAARPNLNAPAHYPEIVLDPTAKSKTKNFDYIINNYGSYASVFNYPKSIKQIATVTDVGGQGCTNVLNGYGKKIVWIIAAYDQISEYTAPDTLVKSLSVDSKSFPSSCAMNTDGDLAVGILAGTNSGAMVIFKKAKGSGSVIKTPLIQEFFDGYDNKGNLFFDGYNASFKFQFAEIPKGSKTPQLIALSNKIQFPGSVQWDGKYVTVFDQLANNLYRYTIKGTKAKLHDTISFTGVSDCAQTWIAGDVVYCGDAGLDDGEVLNYPAGGSPIAVFKGNFDLPLGTVATAE
ncbi:MAG: hypothetical protein ABI431_03030 [Candidatus Tumulicola sp.]